MSKMPQKEFDKKVDDLSDEIVNYLEDKGLPHALVAAALASSYATYCISAGMDIDTFKRAANSLVKTFELVLNNLDADLKNERNSS